MTHILAIHTYGSHRVKHPAIKKMVSAHKIGYTSGASDLLLALYGDFAQDVSSQRASYRYIQITTDTTVRYGYVLLKLSDIELAQAETVAKLHHRADAYLYREGKWLELPNQRTPDYGEPIGHSEPNFNPTGYRIVAASTGEKDAATTGITIEKSQRDPDKTPWFWISGDTYPHREVLKQQGCRWSKKRKAWYLIAWDVPSAIQGLADLQSIAQPDVSNEDAPCSDAEAERILGVTLAPKPPDTSDISDESPEDPPAIRIIKPTLGEDDVLQTAIREVKATPKVKIVATSQRPTRWQLPQESCGELTGSITGNVWCYGWATHEGMCIFVSMGGPRTAVEAIRAKLSKGDVVNLLPDEGAAIELTAGEGNSGLYTDYLHNLPEAKFTSLMLAHELLVDPNYGGKSTTFIFHLSDEQAMAQLKHHVTELVNVSVFDHWAGYLWQAGQSAKLLRKTRSNDGLKLWTVDLDVDSWTRLITGGLSEGIIKFP